MGFEWTELTYQQILAGNTAVLIFPLCVLFVFLTLAAAPCGDPDRAHVPALCHCRCVAEGDGQQHPHVWDFYADLKKYKQAPSAEKKAELNIHHRQDAYTAAL
jgi:hypothetical protein